MRSFLTAVAGALLSLSAVVCHAAPTRQDALHLEVYNPGAKSVFPVSSEIVSGPHEAILIDAQFQRDDAQRAGVFDVVERGNADDGLLPQYDRASHRSDWKPDADGDSGRSVAAAAAR